MSAAQVPSSNEAAGVDGIAVAIPVAHTHEVESQAVPAVAVVDDGDVPEIRTAVVVEPETVGTAGEKSAIAVFVLGFLCPAVWFASCWLHRTTGISTRARCLHMASIVFVAIEAIVAVCALIAISVPP